MSRQLSHSATPQPQQAHPQQQQHQQHQQLKRKAEAGGPSTSGDPFKSSKRRPPIPPLPSLLSLPESKLYSQLLETEQKLDWTLTRKRAEIQDAVTSQRAGAGRVKRTLRMFLSNTTTRPGSSTGAGTDASAGGDRPEPGFVMRLEGRLLDTGNPRHDKFPKRKFSSFISSIIVELPPDVYPAPSNTIEWIRPPPQAHVPQDGFTVMRPLPPTMLTGEPLPATLDVKVHMQLDSSPQRYKVLPQLSAVIGLTHGTRTEIVQAVWAYVKLHGLQDRDDRRRIRNEGPLGQFFAPSPFLSLNHIPELVNRHMTVADPISLSYTLRLDVERHVHPKVFDVQVEIDDPAMKGPKGNSVLNAFLEEDGRDILAIDEEIAGMSVAIRNSRSRRDFLQAFADEPREFMQRWVESQSRDLGLALGVDRPEGIAGTGLSKEDLRKSDTFALPWAEEAVVMMEAQRLASLQQAAAEAGQQARGPSQGR